MPTESPRGPPDGGGAGRATLTIPPEPPLPPLVGAGSYRSGDDIQAPRDPGDGFFLSSYSVGGSVDQATTLSARGMIE
jgi:hypothetical protein